MGEGARSFVEKMAEIEEERDGKGGEKGKEGGGRR